MEIDFLKITNPAHLHNMKPFLISILFLQCKSDTTKTFYFQSIRWKVTVPSYMNIQDSAAIYKSLPKAEESSTAIPNDSIVYDEPYPPKEKSSLINITSRTPINFSEKMLLQVRDTSGWQINASSLSAIIKPLEKGKSWDESLRSMRSEFAGAYAKVYLPKTTVDTVFSMESIDGKIFNKSYFKITGPNWTQNIVVYSRFINRYEFHCVVSYHDSAKGKLFMDIIKKSKFK